MGTGILGLLTIQRKKSRLDLDDLQIRTAEEDFAAWRAVYEARNGDRSALADRVANGLDLTAEGRVLAAQIIRKSPPGRKPLSFEADRRLFDIAVDIAAFHGPRLKTAKGQATDDYGCSMSTVEAAWGKYEIDAKNFYGAITEAANALDCDATEILASLRKPKHRKLMNMIAAMISFVPERANTIMIGALASAMKVGDTQLSQT